MFAYDQNAPLDVQVAGIEARDGVSIRDLSYTSVDGSRVAAYLVAPSKQGKFAGIVFLHGGEQDRSDFLNEALSLVEIGAISLLIDEPSVRTMPLLTDPEADYERYIQIILKLRRGLDLLLSRPDIEPKRIGYIGLSFGAWMGAVLSGIENRVKTYILIAGMPRMTDFLRSHNHPNIVQIRKSLTAEQLEHYLRVTAPLDPINFISRASPASLFFQFARQDEAISESAALQFSQAASEPKLVKWYDAQHHDIFINATALHDRTEWLREHLKRRAAT